MEITLSVRHGDAPDTLKQYVREQVEGLTKYFDRLVEADIILDEETRQRFIAEVRVHSSNDTHFASSEAGDFRSAIDATIDKLRRQLKRHKGKLQKHMPREERERIHGEAITPGEAPSPDASVAPPNWPRISESEAGARLENSDEDVLVFVDNAEGVVKIARRGDDGAVAVEEAETFGLEETE